MASPMSVPPHRPDAEVTVEPAAQSPVDAHAAAQWASPAAIRAALLPEQQAEFDVEYEAALSRARTTLTLDALQHVLRTWRRMAVLTTQDPEGHRQMLATAAEVQRTGQPRTGSVSWTDLRSELGI